MLALMRRIGESVVIGEDIYITVLAIKGNRVLLGFDAPESVTVHRLEAPNKVTASLIEDSKSAMEPMQ